MSGQRRTISTDSTSGAPSAGDPLPPRRYGRLLRKVVAITTAVVFLPVVVLALVDYLQFHTAIHAEARRPIARLTTNSKLAVESFLHERRSALRLIARGVLAGGSCADTGLADALASLTSSHSPGAWIDLAVYDDSGALACFAGPDRPAPGDQRAEEWFHQAWHRGQFVGQVQSGPGGRHRLPMAIRFEDTGQRDRILLAHLGVEQLHAQLQLEGLHPTSDVFLINGSGVLQSPSRRYGNVLESIGLPTPPRTGHTEVEQRQDENGEGIIVGFAQIDEAPFILMLVKATVPAVGGWFDLHMQLLVFLVAGGLLALAGVLLTSRKLIRSFKASDDARVRFFQRMEFTNKLATVGRLAAGVAHEINNPLAIIDQKAGLLNDRLSLGPDFAGKDRALKSTQALVRSVERCSAITHRLLGFAKHMEVQNQDIDLDELLREVLGFLEKEARYREVSVSWQVEPGLPQVRSDPGQLQQVFLNLLNNAIAAVGDGGHIEITVRRESQADLAVEISDDGVGIPAAHMKRIFEPFFTTKPGSGTGLGLAVSYGIIQKLGGVIRVESTPGVGTRFTVVVPTRAP